MRSHTEPAETGTPESKLVQLRAKTDRDLAILLRNALDRSFQALNHHDYVGAEAGYVQAAALLPLARHLSCQDTDIFAQQLGELRAAMEHGTQACA